MTHFVGVSIGALLKSCGLDAHQQNTNILHFAIAKGDVRLNKSGISILSNIEYSYSRCL